jgi:hypothetical protein
MVMFFLFTLRNPSLDGSNKRPTLPGDLPLHLKNLILRCWEEKPEDRPTAEAVVEELELELKKYGVSIANSVSVLK